MTCGPRHSIGIRSGVRDDGTGRGAHQWNHGRGRARARLSLAASTTRAAPATGYGSLALVTLPTSPFWARRYTRTFLDSCRGISKGTAETAELLVSELVTNAVRFAGDPAHTLRYSERANASLISLSLRHFRDGLLIEVYDTDDNPPVLTGLDDDSESGRGLILVTR